MEAKYGISLQNINMLRYSCLVHPSWLETYVRHAHGVLQGGWDKLPFGEAEGISIDDKSVKVPILDWPSKCKFCSLCKGMTKEWYIHWAWGW